MSMDKGFFQPTSRIVDVSLWLKNSDHVITFLWLCGFQKPTMWRNSFVLLAAVKKEKKPEEKFPLASYFLGQSF